MKLCCAITGSNGFVGSTTKNRLLSVGHDVIPLHRPSWSIPSNIDVLIHCAAYIPTSYQDMSQLDKCITANYISTSELLESAKNKGVKTFVYLSSGQIYKWKNNQEAFDTYRASENDPIDPIERAIPYLISKMAGDCLVRSHKSDMRTVVLRPSSIYGPGMKPVGIIHRLYKEVISGEIIDLKNLDYYIDLVHIEDVVTMIQNCVEKKANGAYNVGGDNPIRISSIANMLAQITNKQANVINTKTVSGHPPLNIEKAKQQFGYKPKRLADGLLPYMSSL